MPNAAEYLLKYKIVTDAFQTKAEVAEVDKLLKNLGTGAADSLGKLAGPAATAGAAIAGIGAAATGVGIALYNLTSTAAEYGAAIHDASDKTGLHAEALSAMHLAAKQSNTEMDTITSAVAKFAKTVGGAADGSEEAAKKLQAFGITPQEAINDLDGSLGKVFKRIVDAKPGIEQITLAQKAFGKSGADLLPFIKQFDGDLPGLIKKAKELGLTLSDEDAAAADEFGDTMDLLKKQAQGVAITFTKDLMPVFTDAAKDISSWVANNKDEIAAWGTSTADTLRGLAGLWRELKDAASGYLNLSPDTTKEGVSPGGIGSILGGIPGFFLEQSGAANRIANTPYGPFASDMTKSPTLGTDSGTGGKGGRSPKDIFRLSSQGRALVDAANKLGISPLDLATIIGFETAGTYSPSIRGGAGNKYQGLIQFGADERKAYGVKQGQSFEEQITGPVVKYFQDRFGKAGRTTAGASLLDLYRTVLGGNPNASLTAKDANGTSALSGVQAMLKDHRPAALGRFFGGKEGNIPREGWGKEYLDAVQKTADDDERIWQTTWDRKKEIQSAGVDYLIDQAERELRVYEQTGASYQVASAKAKQIADLKVSAYQDEIDSLEELYDHTTDLTKKEQIRHQIELKTIKMQIGTKKANDDAADTVANLASKYYDLGDALKQAQQNTEDYLAATQNGAPGNGPSRTGSNGLPYESEADRQARLGRTIGSGYEPDAFQTLRDHFVENDNTAMIAGIDAVTQAFQGMGQAVGQVVEAWVLYGSAGASVRQVTAQILASIAQQAAVQSIYELAQGLAVLALAFFGVPNAGPSATAHFAAAAMYGAVAGGTALAGRAVAGNSMKGGAGGGKGTGPGATGAYGGGGYGQQQEQTPYSRQSDNTFISRRDEPARFVAEAIDRLNAKLQSMKPGDVLTAGMQQKPGAVGSQAVTDVRRNSKIGSDLGRAMGMR